MIRRLICTLLFMGLTPTCVYASTVPVSRLPLTFQSQVQEYSVEFVPRINEIPGYENKRDHTVGTVNYASKRILIKDDEMAEHVLYHEWAHIIDRTPEGETGKYSFSSEFLDVYEEEEQTALVFSSYARRSPDEYFCESIAEYYTDPIELQECCPQTYKYIDKLVKESR